MGAKVQKILSASVRGIAKPHGACLATGSYMYIWVKLDAQQVTPVGYTESYRDTQNYKYYSLMNRNGVGISGITIAETNCLIDEEVEVNIQFGYLSVVARVSESEICIISLHGG